MSETKNAFLRYQVLDECFSNMHRKYFLEDLMKICSERISDYYGEEISVSKRTIQYDIDFMKGSGGNFAPIEKYREGRRSYFRYSDPDYSFMKKELDSTELQTLKNALITMSRIKGLPGFDWLSEMQVKLDDALKIERDKEQIIDFEGNDYLRGIEHLHELYRNIVAKRTLIITYHPFINDEQIQVSVSPYYLKEYNKRWFLLGRNHTEKYLQTLALDRIVSIEDSQERFLENMVDFDKYFNEIIGVTNYQNQEVVEVVIQLSDDIIPYLETKPIHKDQWLEGNLLTLNIKLNYELESAILAFGEKMKVVKPNSLREKILQRLNTMVALYR